MEKPLSAQIMKKAFECLDKLLTKPLRLTMGGGGAMILAHNYPLATADVDAIAKGEELDRLDDLVKRIAKELKLPPDWLNPYFSSFSYVIPADFKERVIEVFKGKHLTVEALGREEMLLMKCFAHRAKDRAHARALLRLNPDLKIIENQLDALEAKKIPGVDKARDFLDEMKDEENGG